MGAAYSGGCQCGAVRYEIRAEPQNLYICHCTDCQKQSSSAFGMSLTVPRDALVVTAGEPKQWQATADSGNRKTCSFCGDCGTRLFHGSARNSVTANVKPGTLDDTGWLEPVGNLWTRSAQPWIDIPDSMMNFETEPDDFSDMKARWQARST